MKSLHPGAAYKVTPGRGSPLASHSRSPFMIAKDFVPIPGIKSFAIMRNLAVTLISAITRGGGEQAAVNRAAPGAGLPIMCHYFHGVHDRGP
jgi:hypothetical protein